MSARSGILFDDKTVQIAERTLRFGGAWWDTGRAYHDNMLRWFYGRMQHAPDFTLLDVGASTGAYSLLAAHLPQMRAYAFEPFTEAYEVLCENIALNTLRERVQPHCFALSDTVGTGQFFVVEPVEASGLSQLGGQPRADKQYRSEPVWTTTVDAFVWANRVPRVDVLKIDTEGGELAVLNGALDILRRDMPLVIAEYSPSNTEQYGYHPDRLIELLQGLGYHVRMDHEDIIAERPS